MNKSLLLSTLLALSGLLSGSPSAFAQKRSTSNWVSLFNGKDLTGWETYLRPSEAAPDKTPIGLNKDPHGVFKAENGMIHVSGQDWGGVFTKQSFSNYHLRFQVKFGKKKWPPREHVVADGGLLFHCSMPYDYGSTCWMRSVELQIQETDIGDYHNVGAGIPMMQFSKSKDDADVVDQYDPTAPFQLTNRRVFRSGNFESALDNWTTGELVARGADAVFIVNGFVVNRLFNLYRTDLYQQTTSGQLQFQSEGAEHYLKNIELRPIDFNQKGTPKLVANKTELALTGNAPQTLEIVNQGDAVELIAVELIGKNLEQLTVQLPSFPLTVRKGEKLTIPVSAKPESTSGNKVLLKLETVLGPVPDFTVAIKTN
jgi:hypothetical protein